jgi:putative DNA primase/helicase
MELIAEKVTPADANFIAFRNGILDITSRELIEPNPDIILTNRIEWDYNPAAYSELADRTLNKIACNDPSIRALLEECIGYCFYRRNELGKAFILTGDKNNGKSTFLDCIKAILGTDNISALDLKELCDRFSTSMMFGKLANIGDDISDDFLQGNQVATFKKVVTGNRIKAERKGQDPFEFEPYIKLIASANDIPRMRDKTGAVLRRLVIIPFNASFSKSDPDYDPWIKYKLIQQESIEYMIALGIEGLERIVTERAFTKSEAVENQIKGYEEENNPIVGFLNSIELDDIINEPTSDIFKQYTVFCAENKLQAMGNIAFSKHVCKRLGITTGLKRINVKNVRVYIERNDVM